ncbi:MAG: DUF6605 domain-containing protein [Verrucomicrobiaceae bacterium]
MNVIQQENAREGSIDWQLTRMRLDGSGYRSPVIEGYCSRQSVKAGEVLDVFVSTKPAAKFKIEIFRTGFYGGRGARKLAELGPFDGKEQPTPAIGEKRLRECQWEKCTSITIPADWVSGVYLGRLTTLPPTPDEPYWQSYIVFIVTDDRKADILLQCSDNTWQAYNKWPDNYSLYTDPKGNQGSTSDVSFDRPYAKYAQIYENPQSVGSGEWLCFEFPLAYWLEEQGCDVSYCSNADMISPDRGLKCKTFISVGHDEYWDIRQHDSVAKMRDAGVNLLFLSGNSVCWVTPFSPNAAGAPNRRIFRGGPYGGDYKYAVDREKDHGPYPHRGPDEGYLMGVRNIDPVNGGGDWTCVKPEHRIFEGTGMRAGDSDRWHDRLGIPRRSSEDLPGLEILAAGTAFQGGRNPQQWQAVIFNGPKGNFIFNASTIWWAQGMSKPPGHMPVWSHYSRPHGTDKRVQRITANLLKRALT